METLGKITLALIGMVINFLVGLLGVYVILQIASLFHLLFITQFSFLQIYGALLIISLISYHYEKDKDDSDFTGKLKYFFTGIVSKLFFILAMWGLSFIIYYILS